MNNVYNQTMSLILRREVDYHIVNAFFIFYNEKLILLFEKCYI